MKTAVKRSSTVIGFGWCSVSLVVAMVTGSMSLISVGCTTAPVGVPVNFGEEQDDFPVPPGFTFIPGKSWTYQPAGVADPHFRSWVGTYRGSGKVGTIAPFYVREMQKLGWELEEVRDFDAGRQELTFYKGEEEAHVKMRRKFVSRLGGYGTEIEGNIRVRPLESFADVDSLKRTANSVTISSGHGAGDDSSFDAASIEVASSTDDESIDLKTTSKTP